MIIKKSQLTLLERIILILVILMPLHSMLFDAIIPGNIDNLWRECLLILGIMLVIVPQNGRVKMGKYGVNILLMWVICILYTATSDRILLSLNLARAYLFPTLIYFIIINTNLREEFLHIVENAVIYIAVALAIFGIFQAFVLGDSFLVNLGYPSKDGYLSSSSFYIGGFFGVQRVTSTFSSPNICAVYFGIAILLLSEKMKEIKRSKWLISILFIGIIATFSRSAILGTFFALIVSKFRLHKKAKFPKLSSLGILLIITVGFLIVNYLFAGLFLDMLSSSISSTISLTDTSAHKHLSDLWEPLEKIYNNPFGLGFGHNGPVVLAQYSDANLVESSIYLLAYNFGILGAIIFIYPYLREIFRMLYYNLLNRTSGAICIMVLFTFILLPNIEAYEIIFFSFLYIGINEQKTSKLLLGSSI